MGGRVVDAEIRDGLPLDDVVGALHPGLRFACEPDRGALFQSGRSGLVDANVDGFHARRLHDHVRVACELVVKAFLLDHAFERGSGTLFKDSVGGGAPLERVVHALDDVAALPELLQRLLPTLGDAPRGGRGALDQAQLFQGVEPRKGVRAREPGSVGDRGHVDGASRRNQLAQPPIDRRQALLRYLVGELPLDVEFIPRSKLERGQLLSANAKSLGDVAAIDPDLGAATREARSSKSRRVSLSSSKAAKLAKLAANAVRNYDLGRAIDVLEELIRLGGCEYGAATYGRPLTG
jgi:hypothetical protein